jgi:hypothetical protein
MVSRQAPVVGTFTHLAKYLGCQHDLLAAPTTLGQPAPDDLLGDPLADLPAVHIGGVEEIDAQFQGAIHDRKAVLFAGVRAEVHRAQAQPADLQACATKIGGFHGLPPLR